MALPGSPSQPRLLHRSATSLAIGWQSGSRMGASPLLGYTVEMYVPYSSLVEIVPWLRETEFDSSRENVDFRFPSTRVR